jgi:hypothetical protein
VNLGEAAAAYRAVAERCEASLALDAAEAAARDAVAILRIVTPKRSGALAGSEVVNSVTGGGLHAVANYGPHKIYDKFRNDGGTITRKLGRPHVLGGYGGPYFGHGNPATVTQAGSHYMERGEAAARPAVAAACAMVLDRYLTL